MRRLGKSDYGPDVNSRAVLYQRPIFGFVISVQTGSRCRDPELGQCGNDKQPPFCALTKHDVLSTGSCFCMFSLSHITLKGTQQPRLDDVTLTIDSPRTAIVGYSGAGKTSLLNVLSGFEKPDSGVREVCVPFDNVKQRLPFFWVPENGGLWPHLTVDRHLDSMNASREPSAAILESLDLNHRRTAIPAELSQGERSKLSLARALASQAAVLILDEPLSHVDPVRKPRYWDAVRRLAERDCISLVFSSHEPETVLRHSTHVICMHEGRVLFDGPTGVLYESPPNRLAGEFLGPLNWFEVDEIASFFGESATSQSSLTVRPERLQLEIDPASGIELVASPIHSGAFAESIVRHTLSGKCRSVISLVATDALRTGQRVRFAVTQQR